MFHVKHLFKKLALIIVAEFNKTYKQQFDENL